MSQVRHKRTDLRYDDTATAKSERYISRKPNAELLEHQRKRAIEVKCAEMMDEMEEQGYPEDEIEEKVAEVRKELTDKMTKEQARLTASNDSHSRAEAQQAKNDRAAAAFGIKAG